MHVRIAIVEDNRALRRNLAEQCSFFPGIRCVGSFENAEDALKALPALPPADAPDVVLMDIELPGMNGIDATVKLREAMPACDVLILTVFENEERIFRAIRAGASGYLLKDEAFESIVEAIRELAAGGAPMSPTIAHKVLGLLREGEPVPAAPGAPSGPERPPSETAGDAIPPRDLRLSAREREILEGLVQGETYATLAVRLFISPHTVRTHIRNIYKKLHVQSRAAAVRIALQRGFL